MGSGYFLKTKFLINRLSENQLQNFHLPYYRLKNHVHLLLLNESRLYKFVGKLHRPTISGYLICLP